MLDELATLRLRAARKNRRPRQHPALERPGVEHRLGQSGDQSGLRKEALKQLVLALRWGS